MGGATNLLSDRLQKIRAGCKRKWEAFQALLVTPVRALLSGQERAGDAPAVANAGHSELDTEESEVLAAPDDHGSEIDRATTAKFSAIRFVLCKTGSADPVVPLV